MRQPLFYALKMLWKERTHLRPYLINSELQLPTVSDLPLNQLKNAGIEAIILDFDGVLGGHGAVELTASMKDWLLECIAIFGVNRIFILSNQATLMRQQYFAEHFPGIHFHVTTQKKPNPKGILAILQYSQLQPAQVLMIDDRLATGILAAVLANVKGLWITRPEVTWGIHPIKEGFFYLLRFLERMFVQL